MVANEIRSYAGAAPDTTLAGNITSAALGFTVAGGTGNGYPDGSGGPFYVAIDYDTNSTEKVHCTARVGDVFTVDQRGADGSTAIAHSQGAKVRHCWTAQDAREANLAAHIVNGGALGSTLAGAINAPFAYTATPVVVQTTGTLAVGKWLISAHVQFLPNTGGATTGAMEYAAAVASGTAVLTGSTAGQQTSGTSFCALQTAVSFIATVTVAATIKFTASSGGGSGTIQSTTGVSGALNATGYTAVKIA